MTIRQKVYATSELLQYFSGRQIMGIIEKYGLSYYMRRNMVTIQGVHIIITLNQDVDPMETQGIKVEIGEYWS